MNKEGLGGFELVHSDGSSGILEALQRNPDANIGCWYDGTPSAAVFAVPEGTDLDEEPRVVGFCMQHIGSEDGPKPKIPLLDLSDGWASQKFRLEPLLDRNAMDRFQAVLDSLFEEHEENTSGAVTTQSLLARATKRIRRK